MGMGPTRTVDAAPRIRSWIWWSAWAVVPLAGVLILRNVDVGAIRTAVDAVRAAPGTLLAVVAGYAAAFALRAHAWTRTLPALPLRHALAAIHLSVAANHVLPLRLGEVIRVTSVVRRTDLDRGATIASTITMRAADILAVVVLGVVLSPPIAADVLGIGLPLLVGAGVAAVGAGAWWATRPRRRGRLRAPGPVALTAVLVSWMLEGIVIHQAAAWAGVAIAPTEAMLATAVTIAAQAVAIAPGGFGTYEAAATAVLATLGVPVDTALAVAVTAHGVKTAYALLTGAVAAVRPRPTLLGRLRLRVAPSSPAAVTPADPVPADPAAPVVLFLPAYNEEASVGAVVRRVPTHVGPHPVHCLVVDDGSTDATAGRARAAGAEVIGMGGNAGLGAAVRRGLAEAVDRGAAAVAFCDADGEYAPEELADLVGPILSGSADYVVGSRFTGTIRRMLAHRRLGNRVLTWALAFITRTAITDGQSGYRALSHRAAATAQVIHDFNYAQVLTLDLLARGARYAEVPITYQFRTQGRSFVRLGRYLAAVVPAVHRQVNTDLPLLPGATLAGERP